MEHCPNCNSELEMGQIGLCDSCQESEAEEDIEEDSMKSLPLNTEPVFSTAPGQLGVLWSNLCAAENTLAKKLHPLPLGTVVRSGLDAWYLSEEDEKLVLLHGNCYGDGVIEPSSPSSRFDFSLEWVDDDSIQDYIDTVNKATEEFQTVFLANVMAPEQLPMESQR